MLISSFGRLSKVLPHERRLTCGHVYDLFEAARFVAPQLELGCPDPFHVGLVEKRHALHGLSIHPARPARSSWRETTDLQTDLAKRDCCCRLKCRLRTVGLGSCFNRTVVSSTQQRQFKQSVRIYLNNHTHLTVPRKHSLKMTGPSSRVPPVRGSVAND